MSDHSSTDLPFKRPEKLLLASDIRRELTQEYADSYQHHLAESEEEATKRLSIKLSRLLVEDFQNALGGFIQREAYRLATTGTADALQVQEFLNANPLPPGLAAYLPTEYRVYSLLMNTAKQFISREQAHTDSHVLGNGYKDWAKAAFGTCLVTQEPLVADVEWHHVLRDGRPPIPLTKAGHKKVDASQRQQALQNDPIYQVLGALKAQKAQQKRSYSWPQLRRECEKKGNTAWRKAAQESLQNAGLPYQDEDILLWLTTNEAILARTH